MKTFLFLFFVGVCGLPLHSTAQTGLAYKWVAGTSLNFKASQTDEIEMGGGMMGMVAMGGKQEFRTESRFTLQIRSLLPNGSATGMFFLTAFRVTDTRGNVLANLQNIPKQALTASFTVDRKGNFQFSDAPVLLCRDEGNLLVKTRYKPNEVAASAEIDGEKVSLFAEFNPKTGTLKAGYTATTLKPKPKPVTVKEDDETIDLIPTDFLDMMVLPEGVVAAGQTMKTRMYDTEVNQTMESFDAGQAKIRYQIQSAFESRKFEKDAQKMAGDEEEKDDMAMDADMPPGMGGNGTPSIGQEMEGDMRLFFDNNAGRMQKLEGSLNTKMNMMGMEINQKSTLVLTPVP